MKTTRAVRISLPKLLSHSLSNVEKPFHSNGLATITPAVSFVLQLFLKKTRAAKRRLTVRFYFCLFIHNNFIDNVFYYSCYESVCKSGYPKNHLGGDGDGVGENKNLCSNSFNIPNWVDDGSYTIQWVWFGGAHGSKDQGQHTYVSCVDLNVRGGETFNKKAMGQCPVYKLGDVHPESGKEKCLYFKQSGKSGPELDQCKGGGCSGEYVYGAPPGYDQCKNQPQTIAPTELVEAAPPAVSDAAPVIDATPAIPRKKRKCLSKY